MNRNHSVIKNFMLKAIDNCHYLDLEFLGVIKKIGQSLSGYKLVWRF